MKNWLTWKPRGETFRDAVLGITAVVAICSLGVAGWSLALSIANNRANAENVIIGITQIGYERYSPVADIAVIGDAEPIYYVNIEFELLAQNLSARDTSLIVDWSGSLTMAFGQSVEGFPIDLPAGSSRSVNFALPIRVNPACGERLIAAVESDPAQSAFELAALLAVEGFSFPHCYPFAVERRQEEVAGIGGTRLCRVVEDIVGGAEADTGVTLTTTTTRDDPRVIRVTIDELRGATFRPTVYECPEGLDGDPA